MPLPRTSPRVTVIIPTYNRADLLARAIESVLAQEYANLELIVIDDGSTDETPDVLARFQDERLETVRFKENRGIGASRYEGVSRARGEWISFLDGDDEWHPDKMAFDLWVLEQHPETDVLFDNYRNINHVDLVDQSGFDQTRPAFDRLKTTEVAPGVFRIDSGLPEALLTANLAGTASVVTIRRSLFGTIGNFNPQLSGPEDFELIWRAALAEARFAFQTRVLVERHKDGSSITMNARLFAPRLLEALDLCEGTLLKYGRRDLLGLLNRARQRAYLGLLHACALEGRRSETIRAYRQSLRYGLSAQAFLYVSAAFAGPQAIRLGRRVLRGNRADKS